MSNKNLQLKYTLLCDDVRLEVGNKLSLMGIFQNIFVEKMPVSLLKMAIVQHWRGEGEFTTEVRVLSPDKQTVLASSQPSPIKVVQNGTADNISFFINVSFTDSGIYLIQTLVDSTLFEEIPLVVGTPETIEKLAGGEKAQDFPESVS